MPGLFRFEAAKPTFAFAEPAIMTAARRSIAG
jgi:hypothetical protein